MGARDLLDTLLEAQHACIYAKLRNQSQTSDDSLGQLYSSPNRYLMHHRCICNSENEARIEYLLSSNAHRTHQAPRGSVPGSKALEAFRSAAQARVQSLPQKRVFPLDQTCPGRVAMVVPKKASFGSPSRFVVLPLQVDAQPTEFQLQVFSACLKLCEYGVL